MKSTGKFDVTITCRHDDLSEIYKESIRDRLQKLSRFHSHIVNASVMSDKQNSGYKVEISLHVPGSVITAVNEDYNQKKALDSAYDKVKSQLKKLKSKIVDHRTSQSSAVVVQEETEELDDFE